MRFSDSNVVILDDLSAISKFVKNRAVYVSNRSAEIRMRMNKRKLKRVTRNDMRETLLLVQDLASTNVTLAHTLEDYHWYLTQELGIDLSSISFVKGYPLGEEQPEPETPEEPETPTDPDIPTDPETPPVETPADPTPTEEN